MAERTHIDRDLIAQVFHEGSSIRIVRSCIDQQIGSFQDHIRAACEKAPRKTIRIIFPRLDNKDAYERIPLTYPDHDGGKKKIEQWKANLKAWQEQIYELAEDFQGQHKIELRLTGYAHRYHAYFNDKRGYLGVAFHYTASGATLSIPIDMKDPATEFLLAQAKSDFEHHWEACTEPPEFTKLLQGGGKRLSHPDKNLRVSIPREMRSASRDKKTENKEEILEYYAYWDGEKVRLNNERELDLLEYVWTEHPTPVKSANSAAAKRPYQDDSMRRHIETINRAFARSLKSNGLTEQLLTTALVDDKKVGLRFTDAARK